MRGRVVPAAAAADPAADNVFLLTTLLLGFILNLMVKYMTSQERLDRTFAALADPTRRAILSRLARGETPVTELAGPFKISLPAVSKHLKVLERAGLIARGREARWRPCRLKARPMKEAVDWLEHYRRFWEESFDRLDDYLRELQQKEKSYGRTKR